MRADLGLDNNVNSLLHFLRLSIVTWLHATSSSIETVCAKWRILAYITIILNTDMGMPKRWVTINWLLFKTFTVVTPQLFLTLKTTAVVSFLRAACQWSGQHLRFSLGMLQPFPAKVMCMCFFSSNCKVASLSFFSGRMIFSRETTIKSISIFRDEYSMSHVVIQPDPSSCDLKTLITTEQNVLLSLMKLYLFFLFCFFLSSWIYFNGKFTTNTWLVDF